MEDDQTNKLQDQFSQLLLTGGKSLKDDEDETMGEEGEDSRMQYSGLSKEMKQQWKQKWKRFVS